MGKPVHQRDYVSPCPSCMYSMFLTRSRPSKSERGDPFIVRPIVRFMDFVPQQLTKLIELTDPTAPMPIRAPHHVSGRSRRGDHHG